MLANVVSPIFTGSPELPWLARLTTKFPLPIIAFSSSSHLQVLELESHATGLPFGSSAIDPERSTTSITFGVS